MRPTLRRMQLLLWDSGMRARRASAASVVVAVVPLIRRLATALPVAAEGSVFVSYEFEESRHNNSHTQLFSRRRLLI